MKALVWHGKYDVRVDDVPEPKLANPHDAIVKITTTAICGSDLHLYDNVIPTMEKGDVLGHEFMGEVVEIGSEVKKLKVGDRVVVPFTIACGKCFFCQRNLWSLCDNSNPNSKIAETLYGYSPSGLFGYSHLLGGYAGGQAEYARVPFADVGPMKVPDGLDDEKVLFLTDIFPTGYQAVENCGIKQGDTVAIWGAGPVGQFAIASAFMLGAEKVISIDNVPDRLEMSQKYDERVVTINYDDKDASVLEKLRVHTGGHGPDHCVDCVGLEAHGHTIDAKIDMVKEVARLATDRPHVLREAIQACAKGGTVSLAGVYGGMLDKIPMGAAFSKGLTFKMGQTHVHRYLKPLMRKIEEGAIDPSFVITHRLNLSQAPEAYKVFREKQDHCIKVVLKPDESATQKLPQPV